MTGLWFLQSAILIMTLNQCIKFHLFIFNTFNDMLWTSLLLQQIRQGNNSVITCDRFTVLTLCTSSDCGLSMHHVSFNSLLYIQRYAPDKLFIAKIKKGFCSCILQFYHCIKFHLFIFNTFRDMLRTSLL